MRATCRRPVSNCARRGENFEHREATAAPMPVASDVELARTDRLACMAVIEQTADGWQPGAIGCRLTRLSTVRIRARAAANSGSCRPVRRRPADQAIPPPNSCVFVGPDDRSLPVTAGSAGAEAVCGCTVPGAGAALTKELSDTPPVGRHRWCAVRSARSVASYVGLIRCDRHVRQPQFARQMDRDGTHTPHRLLPGPPAASGPSFQSRLSGSAQSHVP